MHHYDIISDAGEVASTVILGRINMFHAREDLVDPTTLKVDESKMRNVSRLGGILYGRTTSTFEIPRPVWNQEKETEAMVEALENRK